MASSKPLMKLSAGPVACAIWENSVTANGQSITVLKATLERRYKDKDGTWKSTHSFNRNEIPLAIYCLGKAWERILTEESQAAVPRHDLPDLRGSGDRSPGVFLSAVLAGRGRGRVPDAGPPGDAIRRSGELLRKLRRSVARVYELPAVCQSAFCQRIAAAQSEPGRRP